MRALTTAEILRICECGASASRAERLLLLVSGACDDLPCEGLGKLTVGERDARLFSLRAQIFGPQLDALCDCPACGQCAALRFSAADVQGSQSADTPESLTLTQGDFKATFRLPIGLDLVRLNPHGDTAANRLELLEQCLVAARHRGEEISARQLPEEVVMKIAERMAEADPRADVQLALTCPQCGHRWTVPFDIAGFLWMELSAFATRLLREVHELASAYGWSEADILALSPQRRQVYLDLVRA